MGYDGLLDSCDHLNYRRLTHPTVKIMINTNKFLIPFSIPILVKILIIFLSYFLYSRSSSEPVFVLFVALVLFCLWILYTMVELTMLVFLLKKITTSDHPRKKDKTKLISYIYGLCISLLANLIIIGLIIINIKV